MPTQKIIRCPYLKNSKECTNKNNRGKYCGCKDYVNCNYFKGRNSKFKEAT